MAMASIFSPFATDGVSCLPADHAGDMHRRQQILLQRGEGRIGVYLPL
jgi:hypothetical protein